MDADDFRVLSVIHALDRMLDCLDPAMQAQRETSASLGRIDTGVTAIDQLLGGVPTGELTVISAEREIFVDTLAAALMVHSTGRATLAMANDQHAVRTLLAAQSGVPYAFLESGALTDDDWERIHAACKTFVDRQTLVLPDRSVYLTMSTSVASILHAAQSVDSALCVVVAPERLGDGPLVPVLDDLAELARSHSFAIVALTAHSYDKADAYIISLNRLGRSVELVAPDPIDLLRRTHASVEPHSRTMV